MHAPTTCTIGALCSDSVPVLHVVSCRVVHTMLTKSGQLFRAAVLSPHRGMSVAVHVLVIRIEVKLSMSVVLGARTHKTLTDATCIALVGAWWLDYQ